MERKSVKRKKIDVELKLVDDCFCLVFTLKEPYLKVIIGCSNYLKLENPKDISQKISTIFYNKKRENVYCLEEDIEKCFLKIENIYLNFKDENKDLKKDKKVKK